MATTPDALWITSTSPEFGNPMGCTIANNFLLAAASNYEVIASAPDVKRRAAPRDA